MENDLIYRRLLKINIAVATFVLLANGSALFLGLSQQTPEVLTSLLEISLILIVSIAIIVTALIALSKPEYRYKALVFQSGAISVGVAALMIWGFSLANPSAEGLGASSMKVGWSVGWLTALASYSAYLVSHTFMVRIEGSSMIVRYAYRYAYIWVGVIAFAIDVFIFLRIAAPIL